MKALLSYASRSHPEQEIEIETLDDFVALLDRVDAEELALTHPPQLTGGLILYRHKEWNESAPDFMKPLRLLVYDDYIE